MRHFVALTVGRDLLLLETRSGVLSSGGYTVVSTLSGEQALGQFKAGDFDVVMLCGSIPGTERERLAKAIHAHSPTTPVVMVRRTTNPAEGGANGIFANEAEELLREIPAILGKFPPDHGRTYVSHADIRRRA